jgi:hypothetical protein
MHDSDVVYINHFKLLNEEEEEYWHQKHNIAVVAHEEVHITLTAFTTLAETKKQLRKK